MTTTSWTEKCCSCGKLAEKVYFLRRHPADIPCRGLHNAPPPPPEAKHADLVSDDEAITCCMGLLHHCPDARLTRYRSPDLGCVIVVARGQEEQDALSRWYDENQKGDDKPPETRTLEVRRTP